ncbi:MAG: IS630 family transposase [Cyanobacteria bacterium J06638_6]
MPAAYSLDLRQKAIAALEAGHSKAAVSRLMGIGTTTLTEWHNRYRASGEVAAKQGYQQGHSHKITDWEAFRAFAATHGDKTQAEMAQLWPEEISEDTIGRALKRILHAKKKSYLYAERESAKRQAYDAELAQYEAYQRVYLDEAGIDNTEDYGYGWCPKGERFAAERRGKRTERVSFMAAWSQHQLVAPLTYEGYCNRAVFETWLDEQLLPALPYGSVIICDNASFHKGGRIEALIQQAGCYLLYLPPYSPDLNPIEHQWFVLKNHSLE